MSELFDNGQEIDSIYIDIQANLVPLQKQLRELSKQKTNTLTVNFDQSQLSTLNQHLNLKQKHLSETISYYQRNVITPRTDLTHLNQLNRQLKDLQVGQNQKVTFYFDDREIFKEISNIRKELQATKFKIALDTNNISSQIEKALQNTSAKVNVNVKVRESTGTTKNDYKELSLAIKQVEKAVYKTDSKKGVIGTIGTGILEGLGATINQSIVNSLRKDLNINVNNIARPFTKFVAKPLSKVTPESIKQFEDVLVDALEQQFIFKNTDAAKSKFQEALKPAMAEITETILESVSGSLQALAQPLRIRKRVMLAKSAQEAAAIAENVEIPDTEIEKINKAKSISLITGGIDFQKGGLNTYFAENLVKRVLPGSYSKPVTNPYSNDKENLGFLYQMAQQYKKSEPMPLDMLLHTGVEKGYNPDSVKMAAEAMAYRKKFPDKPIQLAGTSGGTYVVEEAIGILERAGIKNVKGIGITAPVNNLMPVASTENYQANVGDLDPLNIAMFGSKYVSDKESLAYKRTLEELPLPVLLTGLLNKSAHTNIIPGAGVGHALLPFLAEPEFQKNIQTFLGSNINEISENLTGQKGIANLDFLRIRNDERATIPRTLAAVFNDPKVLKQIQDQGFTGEHGYTFAVPQKPDWRRDNDFASMMKTVAKKGKRTTGEGAEEFKEYNEFLNQMLEGLKEFLDSGAKVKTKLLTVLNDAVKFYPELESVQKRVIGISEEYSNLVKINKTPIAQDTRTAKEKYQDISRQRRIESQFPQGFDFSTSAEKTVKDELQKTVENAKAIASSFSEAYGTLKQQIKNKQFPEATTQAKTILENTARAKQDIENVRSSSTIPKIGTPEASQINQALGQLSTLENNIKRQFAKAKIPLPEIQISEVKQIGKDVTAGLAQGLDQGKKEIKNAANDLAENLIETVQEDLGIQSPSTVFRTIGEFVAQGFEIGLTQVQKIDIKSIFDNVLTDTKELFIGFFNKAGINTKDLISGINTLGTAFLFLTQGLPALKDFLGTSLQVATEMENINRQVVFASGDSATGKTNLQRFSQQAKDLKVDLRQTLEGASSFLAATQNSSLEGAPSTQILENFNVLLATRSVDKQTQERFNLAISQMASKGVQSEELRGQASEAIPGFMNIFARSQGLNPSQLAKKLKNTPGGLNPETLVTASQQARAESITGLNESLDTSQASINRFNNSLLELQTNVGNAFLPLQKFGTNVISGGIELISGHIDKLVNGFKLLAIFLTRPLWQPFIKFLFDLSLGLKHGILLFNGMAFSVQGLKASIMSTVTVLKPLVGQLLLFQSVLTIFDILALRFKDMGSAATDFAKQSTSGLKDIEKAFAELNGKESVNKITGKDVFVKSIQNILSDPLRHLNPFDNRNRELDKKYDDVKQGTRTGLESGRTLIQVSNSSDIQKQIESVVEIDKKLSEVQAKRRAIIQTNPEDIQGLKNLQKQEKELLESRFKNLSPVGAVQGQIEAQIRGLKATKPLLKELYEQNKLTTDQYESQTQSIDEQIETLEKRQTEITKSVGKTVNAFEFWKQSLLGVNTALQDTKTSIDYIATKNKIAFTNSQITGNVTPGNQQFVNSTLDINTAQRQIELLTNSIIQSQSLFKSGTESSNVLAANKVDDSTGINQINQIISQSESDNDKFILQQFAELQQNKQELNQLQLQVSQSKLELVNQLREQTKQVAEYYQGITRQVEQSKIEFQKGVNDINTLKQQNKIKSALIGVGDNIFTQFADSLVSNLQDMNDIANGKLDKKSKILDAQFQLQDNLKQTVELQRSLPGAIPKIPVTLDFTGIDNDENVRNLNDNLQETNSVTGLINQGLESFNQITNENVIKSSELTSEFDNQILKVQTVSDKTVTWQDSLKNVFDTSQGITGVFENVANSITGVVQQTTNWLTSLTTGQGLIQNVTGLISGNSNLTGLQTGIGNNPLTTLQNVFQGALNPVSGKASTVKMQRTGKLDENGLEQLMINVFGSDGKSVGTFAANSGVRSTQNKFGRGGTTRAGSLAPVEYGTYNIAGETAGIGAGVGKTFIPVNPTFKTNRSAIGFHLDANRQNSPGSAGCIVFANEAEFSRFRNALKNSGAKQLIFEEGIGQVGIANAANGVSFNGLPSIGEVTKNVPDLLTNFVKQKESFKARAYSDYGQYSVGYGTRAKSPNEVISHQEAENRLNKELINAVNSVKRSVKVPLNENQLSALSSLVYNAGSLENFPTLLNALNSGNYNDAAKAFLNINKVTVNGKKKVLPGLTTRRQQESQMFLSGSSLSNTALQGNFVNPDQLQSTVAQGSQLNAEIIQQRSVIDQGLIDQENKRKAIELQRKNEQALRTFRRGLRDSSDQTLSNARQFQDIESQYGNPIKSSQESFREQITKQEREFSDNIRDRQRLIIDIDDKIQTARQLLLNPDLTNQARTEIEKGLSQSLAEKNKTQQELAQLQKLKNESIQTAKNIFNTQENFRQQSITFEQTQQEITNLQTRVESLKALQQFNPLAEQVKEIPSLERMISLKQLDLETEKNIAAVQEKLFKKELNQNQADAQIELFKKQSIAKQEQIELTFQEAERQRLLNELTREANNLQRERQAINDRLQNQLAAINILQRRNPLDFSAGNPLEINRDIQLSENDSNYQQKRNEIFANNELTEQQRKGEFLRAALRNSERNSNINKTFKTDTLEQRIKDIQNSNQRQKTVEDFVNQPRIDLLNLQAGRQGNQFVGNRISREAGTLQENIRYAQQLRDIEAQIEQMRFNNLDTSGLEAVRTDLEAIHNLNLENVNDQFKTFGATIDDVTKNAVMGLSNSLTDLILKGGSLNDFFDNFFNTVLSGAINVGLNSLLGGLFYDGGIVPNYALGGYTRAFNKEFAESGRKPMLAVVHQGELMIPADRVEKLSQAGLTPEKLLGNFAFGGIVGKSINTSEAIERDRTTTVKVESTVINNQEYVTIEQFQQGLQETANRSVKNSVLAVQSKMQNSNSYRRSVGI